MILLDVHTPHEIMSALQQTRVTQVTPKPPKSSSKPLTDAQKRALQVLYDARKAQDADLQANQRAYRYHAYATRVTKTTDFGSWAQFQVNAIAVRALAERGLAAKVGHSTFEITDKGVQHLEVGSKEELDSEVQAAIASILRDAT